MYLKFIEEMSDICRSANIPISDLFDKIARGRATFTSSDLFSFLLTLPVIFSTEDTDVICQGLQLDKSTK